VSTLSAVVDLRDARAYADSRPAGAVRLTPEDVGTRAYLLPPRVRPLLLIGSTPEAVAPLLDLLRRAERNVRHLPGESWRDEIPIETGPPTRTRLWEESAWVRHAVETYRPSGNALDLACGSGRNAVYLAMQGLRVTAIDRLADALENARDLAQRSSVQIETRQHDLETSGLPPRDTADVVVVVRYLERLLFAAIAAAVRPGGLLVYETFTRAQAALGHPRNPRFMLDARELAGAFPHLETLEYAEGFFDGAHLARLIARRRP
jgi:SAM-dependent methyltransferase